MMRIPFWNSNRAQSKHAMILHVHTTLPNETVLFSPFPPLFFSSSLSSRTFSGFLRMRMRMSRSEWMVWSGILSSIGFLLILPLCSCHSFHRTDSKRTFPHVPESVSAFLFAHLATTTKDPSPFLCEELTLRTNGEVHRQRERMWNRIQENPFDPRVYVDPFIGTGGDGYGVGGVPPGAQVPFGNVRLSPDTSLEVLRIPWRHPGGYSYCDSYVRAVSHTHLVGAGILDYGNIGVMPTNDMSNLRVHCFNPVAPIDPKVDLRVCDFRAQFSHDEEMATPGYYSVFVQPMNFGLLDLASSPKPVGDPIRIELTAGLHVGVHRYTWSSSANNYLVFDLGHAVSFNPGCIRNASIDIDVHSQTLSGEVFNVGDFTGRIGGLRVYFVARFNRQFISEKSGTWISNHIFPNVFSQRGYSEMGGAFLYFSDADSSVHSVEIFVGISYVSIEQAWKNLNAEVSSSDTFDTIHSRTSNQWLDALRTIQIDGVGSNAKKSIRPRMLTFTNHTDNLIKAYSALYHAYLAPTTWTENGGIYMGFDKKTHVSSSRIVTDLSIWDTMRTQLPFLTIGYPAAASWTLQSLLVMNEQLGYLPRWPLANGEGGSMEGCHAAVMFLAGFHLDNVRNVNYTSALEAMAKTIRSQEQGDYLQRGWFADQVCKTLEFALDDRCTAELALHLGQKDIAQDFFATSKNFANVWDPHVSFFCSKSSDGSYPECESPDFSLEQTYVFDSHYVEGDAWHWRWFVPQDVPSLIHLFGSNTTFVDQLDTFFERSVSQNETFLPNEYYWAGNEPDIQAPFLFPYASRPDLTQKWARWVADNRYSSLPNGLGGNDDYGTLSSWFLFASIGMYPEPCSGRFVLSSPMFDDIRIFPMEDDNAKNSHRQEPSLRLHISRIGGTPDSYLSESVRLNSGPPLEKDKYFVHIGQCMRDAPQNVCSIEFHMS